MMESVTVPGRCPVCGELVPLFSVTPVLRGWWRRRLFLVVDADASDYVLHMWSHTERGGRSGAVL